MFGCFVFVWVVAVAGFIVWCIWNKSEQERLGREQEEAKRLEEKARLAQREREQQARISEAETAARKAAAEAASALAVTRRAEEEAAQARREAQLARRAFEGGGKNLGEMDRFLRDGQMLFQRLGERLKVQVFALPTGRVGLQWMVEWDRPYAPNVEVTLVDKSTDRESAFQGTWIRTLKCGKTHAFKLSVYDGSKLVESLPISVKVPTPEQFGRTMDQLLDGTALGAEQHAAMRKKLEAFVASEVSLAGLMKEGEEKVKKLGLDPDQEQGLLAKLQAWVAREEEKT